MKRNLIFISHATPEDNGFVRWLGARLELAGFSVWHDLDRLKGGDYFWDKIEVAIRNDSFRFLAVVSTAAVNKPGVKDEWALAQTIERSLPGFVIPLRIDDYNFSLLPIGLHRKNVVDFAKGWHIGLAALLDTLAEAKAPKATTPDPRSTKHWLAETKDGAIQRTQFKETLDSTWLSVLSLPPIQSARILGTSREIKVTNINRHIPWFEHDDRIIGFAKSAELVSNMSDSVMLATASGGIDSTAFIESGSKLGVKDIPPQEARKRVANLVRQAWELSLEKKGFGIHEQSGRRKVFYVTPELTKGRGEKVQYIDADGSQRRRGLNGRSEARKANWHYAVGMVPQFDEPWRIELRPTIVFTDDNGVPFSAPLKAHRLRMSFCRSWWNDRWRGFLRAFLVLVSDGQPEIRLPVGSEREVIIAATPISFISPVGLSDLPPSIEDEPIDDIEHDLDDEDIFEDQETAL